MSPHDLDRRVGAHHHDLLPLGVLAFPDVPHTRVKSHILVLFCCRRCRRNASAVRTRQIHRNRHGDNLVAVARARRDDQDAETPRHQRRRDGVTHLVHTHGQIVVLVMDPPFAVQLVDLPGPVGHLARVVQRGRELHLVLAMLVADAKHKFVPVGVAGLARALAADIRMHTPPGEPVLALDFLRLTS